MDFENPFVITSPYFSYNNFLCLQIPLWTNCSNTFRQEISLEWPGFVTLSTRSCLLCLRGPTAKQKLSELESQLDFATVGPMIKLLLTEHYIQCPLCLSRVLSMTQPSELVYVQKFLKQPEYLSLRVAPWNLKENEVHSSVLHVYRSSLLMELFRSVRTLELIATPHDFCSMEGKRQLEQELFYPPFPKPLPNPLTFESRVAPDILISLNTSKDKSPVVSDVTLFSPSPH